MKKLSLLILLLCSLFSIALIVVRAVGFRAQPTRSMRILEIKNCEQPCVMGITLGKTTYTEAKRILGAFHLSDGYKIKITVEETPSEIGRVGQPILEASLSYPGASQPIAVSFVFDGQDTVQEIHIFSATYTEFMPSLADIVPTYGVPRCAVLIDGYGENEIAISIEDKARRWTMNASIYITLNGSMYGGYDGTRPLDWSQSVGSLSYYKLSDTVTDAHTMCHCVRWQGIAHIKSPDGSYYACLNNS